MLSFKLTIGSAATGATAIASTFKTLNPCPCLSKHVVRRILLNIASLPITLAYLSEMCLNEIFTSALKIPYIK